MRRTYLLIFAALSAAMLLSACQKQAGTAAAESGQEQGAQTGGAGDTSGENAAGEGAADASGSLAGGSWGLNGNSVVGSNFISQSTPVTEIPIGSLGKIELPDYQQVNVTLSVDMANTEATDSAVDTYIRSQLQSELKTVSGRGAGKGDTVTVDYLGLVDGVSFTGNQGTDYPIVLGSGQMLSDFEAALYDTKEGDKVKAEVHFPDDYTVEEVAGKTAQFEITVKKLQEPSVLDESFIAKHTRTGAASEGDYREEIRSRLHTMYENQLQYSAVSVAISQLAASADLEPSAAFQNYLYQYYKNDLDSFLEQNSLTMDDYKEQTGLDDTGVENAILTNVQNSMASIMVMRQIAEDQSLINQDTMKDTMKDTLVQFLSDLYDREVSKEDLEAAYGEETSQMELQAVVFEYMKNHVNISFQAAESTGQ